MPTLVRLVGWFLVTGFWLVIKRENFAHHAVSQVFWKWFGLCAPALVSNGFHIADKPTAFEGARRHGLTLAGRRAIGQSPRAPIAAFAPRVRLVSRSEMKESEDFEFSESIGKPEFAFPRLVW
jgi:hypothetical protein